MAKANMSSDKYPGLAEAEVDKLREGDFGHDDTKKQQEKCSNRDPDVTEAKVDELIEDETRDQVMTQSNKSGEKEPGLTEVEVDKPDNIKKHGDMSSGKDQRLTEAEVAKLGENDFSPDKTQEQSKMPSDKDQGLTETKVVKLNEDDFTHDQKKSSDKEPCLTEAVAEKGGKESVKPSNKDQGVTEPKVDKLKEDDLNHDVKRSSNKESGFTEAVADKLGKDDLTTGEIQKDSIKSYEEYPGLAEAEVDDLREDDFTHDQIKKRSDRKLAEIKSFLDGLTHVNVAGQRQKHRKELRLVLLGKTGAGKSSTGNTILGKQAFEESAKSVSCTELIKEESAVVNGINVRIIDTPGLFDTSKGMEHIFTEIAKVLDSFSEGIHGFLFVFSLGNPRFTTEEKEAFDQVEKSFKGPSFLDHCFVVLTGATKEVTLSQRVHEEKSTPFGQLITNSVKGKVIAVDNKNANKYFREEIRKRLVELVANSVDVPYTNKVFEAYSTHKKQAAANLPKSVQHLAPKIDSMVARKFQQMSYDQMTRLSHVQTQRIADDIYDQLKVKQTHEPYARPVPPEGDVRKAVTATQKRVVIVYTDKSWLKKAADFGGKLLCAAGNVIKSGVSKVLGWFGW